MVVDPELPARTPHPMIPAGFNVNVRLPHGLATGAFMSASTDSPRILKAIDRAIAGTVRQQN
jgi:hypothetical protein